MTTDPHAWLLSLYDAALDRGDDALAEALAALDLLPTDEAVAAAEALLAGAGE